MRSQGTCSINGCERLRWARSWCPAHYSRWRKYGDPLGGGTERARGTPEQRLWPKINKNGPIPAHRPELGPCWPWTAATNPLGYATISTGARGSPRIAAHRLAYELLVGPIPDGLVLDHLCRNPPCVNPAHLEPVTIAENIRRGVNGLLTTHCPQGHPYDNVNTSVRKNRNGRECRTCQRERARERHRRMKEMTTC